MKHGVKKMTKDAVVVVAACGIIYLKLAIETLKSLRRNNDNKKTK